MPSKSPAQTVPFFAANPTEKPLAVRSGVRAGAREGEVKSASREEASKR